MVGDCLGTETAIATIAGGTLVVATVDGFELADCSIFREGAEWSPPCFYQFAHFARLPIHWVTGSGSHYRLILPSTSKRWTRRVFVSVCPNVL